MTNSKKAYTQSGFTLIELMITLVLGLLISAAALQLFYNTSRNVRVQESADDVQDAVVFSLGYIQKEIAMSNLGSYRPMTYDSAWTGIVFSDSTPHPTETLVNPKTGAPTSKKRQIGNLRGININTTKDILTKQNVGFSNIQGVKSDQLTIQYKAPFDMTDCAGNQRTKGQMIIENFHTNIDPIRPAGDPDALNIVLACRAGTYNLNNQIPPSQVDENIFGNIEWSDDITLINRLDYFKVLLGIQAENGTTYMTVNEYRQAFNDSLKKAENDRARGIVNKTYFYQSPIVAIQIGVLTRGINPVSTDTQTNFNVLGSNVNIDNTQRQYVRRVYEHTIRLRNGVE